MKVRASLIIAVVGFWPLFNLSNKVSAESHSTTSQFNYPIVVNTWPFVNATAKAWETLIESDDPIETIVSGCSACEQLRCDGTVGYGGSPDEYGESTLDAVIMDAETHDAGAVASLKRVKNAIGVALAVMKYTKHTMLVGEAATQFAIDMGFKQEDLHAPESMQAWLNWFNNSCQPNFRINVSPDPAKHCGPYKPIDLAARKTPLKRERRYNRHVSEKSHDTIGMIAINSHGKMAGGTSTNGASHKIPG